MKKKIDKVKDEIATALVNHRKKKGRPLTSLWLEIEGILKYYKVNRPFSFPEFKKLYFKFDEIYYKDSKKAVTGFLHFLSTTPEPTIISDIPKVSCIQKPKGIKRTRGDDLKYYKSLMNMFDYISPLSHLVSYKSYLTEKYKNPDNSCNYMRRFYNISPEQLKEDIETFKEIDEGVIKDIRFLQKELAFAIPLLLRDRKTPQSKKWFVDVFQEASERYFTDWRKYCSNTKRKPDFKKSFDVFKRFVNGASPQELGYANTYHNLRYEVVPQGAICFLFLIHTLLYDKIDTERALLREKANQIKEILKDIPEHQAVKLIEDIAKYHYRGIHRGGGLLPGFTFTIDPEKEPIF